MGSRRLLLWRLLTFAVLLVVETADPPKVSDGRPSGSAHAAAYSHHQSHAVGAVLQSLSSLQHAKGGFGRPPSLLATRRALFLAQLYGLLDKIDRKRAAEFVLQATDQDQWLGWTGSGKSGGYLKSMDAVHSAVFCHMHLSKELGNVTGIAALLGSAWDADVGLFRMTPEGTGDIQSSALALTVAEQAGKLHAFDEQAGVIRARLHDSLGSMGEKGLFIPAKGECGDLSHVVCNYYFVLLAGLTGLSLDPVIPRMVETIVSLQNLDRSQQKIGGIFKDVTRSGLTLSSTLYGVATLHSLSLLSDYDSTFTSQLDMSALGAFLASAPSDMESAYMAHRALAYTPIITNYFETKVSYDILNGLGWGTVDEGAGGRGDVVQGTVMRPMLSVTTFGKNLTHSGLEVIVSAKQQNGKDWIEVFEGGTSVLTWDKAKGLYTSPQAIDTGGMLGELRVEFTVNCLVGGLGEIYFDVSDTKMVGFGMKIQASAWYKGEAVDVYGKVGLGANFEFSLQLFTRGAQPSGALQLPHTAASEHSSTTVGSEADSGSKAESGGQVNQELSAAEAGAGGGGMGSGDEGIDVIMSNGDFMLTFVALDPSSHEIGRSRINGLLLNESVAPGAGIGDNTTDPAISSDSKSSNLAGNGAAESGQGEARGGESAGVETGNSTAAKAQSSSESSPHSSTFIEAALSKGSEGPQAQEDVTHSNRSASWEAVDDEREGAREDDVQGDAGMKMVTSASSMVQVGLVGSAGAGNRDDAQNRTSTSSTQAGLQFTFALSNDHPLPAGRLYFVFQVAQATTGVVHTIRRTVWYNLDVQMVATDIKISRRVPGGEAVAVEAGFVNLADTVLVEMTPGVLQEGGQVALLDSTWSNKHQFIIELLTPSGKKLGIVQGRPADGSRESSVQRLVFEHQIGSTLRSIGVNVVNFLFVPPSSAGPSVKLLVSQGDGPHSSGGSNDRDNDNGGVGRGGLNLTVSSMLRVQRLKAPAQNALLEFGSTLTLNFTIVDALSGVQLGGRFGGSGRVFMAVYASEGSFVPFQVDSKPIVDGEHGMSLGISWHIDANAAQGSFVLGLKVQDEDGVVSDLGSSEDGKPWRHHIRIGGPVKGVVVSTFASPTTSSWWRDRDFTRLDDKGLAGPPLGVQGVAAVAGKGGGGGGGEAESAKKNLTVQIIPEIALQHVLRLRAWRSDLARLLSLVRTGEGFAAFNLVFRLISVGRAGGDDSDMVGARLVARVHCSSRSISGREEWRSVEGLEAVDVASGGGGDVYQISFALDKRHTQSGKVKVMVFRQVDLDRFAWMREHADQKRREAEDMARARGMPYIGGGDITKAPPPLFEHTMTYSSPTALHDWFGHERLILLLGPVAFAWVLAIIASRLCLGILFGIRRSERKVGRWHERNRRRRARHASPTVKRREANGARETQQGENHAEDERPVLLYDFGVEDDTEDDDEDSD